MAQQFASLAKVAERVPVLELELERAQQERVQAEREAAAEK